MQRKMLWNDLVIWIPQINTSRSFDMQISLRIIDGSSRRQQVVGNTWLNGNGAPIEEQSIEIIESFGKIIQEIAQSTGTVEYTDCIFKEE